MPLLLQLSTDALMHQSPAQCTCCVFLLHLWETLVHDQTGRQTPLNGMVELAAANLGRTFLLKVVLIFFWWFRHELYAKDYADNGRHCFQDTQLQCCSQTSLCLANRHVMNGGLSVR